MEKRVHRKRREAVKHYERVLSLRGANDLSLELALAPFEDPEMWDALTNEQQALIELVRDEFYS